MLSKLSTHIKDPSVLRRAEFAATFYPRSMPSFWNHLASFSLMNKEHRNSLTVEEARQFIENVEVLNKDALSTDLQLTNDIIGMARMGTDTPLGVVLISGKDNCRNCGSKLYVRADRPSTITVYNDSMGTLPGTHYTKYCRSGRCSLQQHYGFYAMGSFSEVRYDEDWATLPYFMSTREIAFTVDMLCRLDKEILIGQVSYKQRADIYNDIHGYVANKNTDGNSDQPKKMERKCLDRRRLEAAHFKFAVLRITSWYSNDIKQSPVFSPDHQEDLLKFTPIYQQAFHKKYSGHRCNVKGCGTTLVLDGNQKNNCTVCAAEEAGYVQYHGLPGMVKTGCMNTPLQASTFCSLHKPREMKTESESSVCGQIRGTQRRVIESILQHKRTRNGSYYQVLWLGKEECKVTWEPEENVPASVIEEFKQGLLSFATEVVHSSGLGQTMHTLTVSQRHSSAVASVNHKSTPRVVPENDGVFESKTDDSGTLACNTEKDKEKLHYRTAGYIVYDDGCHLKKFATNPVRSSLTPTAKQIAETTIVVDKMHFKGHTDEWCKQQCDPNNFSDLENVDTEICEQTFSWLSRYARITRHMNSSHFKFYILYLCDLHNRKLSV